MHLSGAISDIPILGICYNQFTVTNGVVKNFFFYLKQVANI